MERYPQAETFHEETALAQRVARIFGYDGLEIEVREGAGWQTIKGEEKITMVVDPAMLQPKIIKDATGKNLPEQTELPEQYSVYGIAHELGHIDDFMHPALDFEKAKKASPAEHFFWNILDDSVINRRLRNIPLLNSLTDDIYKDILFPVDDLTSQPKHIQFMYGWLLDNVTPKRKIILDEAVGDALEGLKKIRINNKSYDIGRTLAHLDTDYALRQEIAKAHIWPLYEAFIEEDKQNKQQPQQDQSQNPQQSSGEGGSQAGGGQSDSEWQDVYDAYHEAAPCSEHTHDKEDGAGHEQPHNSKGSGTNPHEAIQKAAEGLLDKQKAESDDSTNGNPNNSKTQSAPGAGSIAAELQLSPGDAKAYEAIITTYHQQIHAVAKILQQLTVPSIEYMSPRYERRASTDGLRLSPRDLFQVVIAHHSNIDPAVWQPVNHISRKEGYSFDGLDIHLLIDISSSMQGDKANSAAACSVVLMEGIAAARRLVQRQNPHAPKPDVRLEVILFGSSAQVVAPLGTEISPRDKGITFTNVRNAGSGSTIVAGAIAKSTAVAAAFPRRTQLMYIISDGDFSDSAAATQKLHTAGPNFYLYQYILQSPGTKPISNQASHINKPEELPGHLQKQLRILANKFL